jgi:dTDP-4-dehydrorhamnose reductase
MIHFSTDFVFDGEKGTAYTEEDSPAPISVYGRSKLQGETMIREVGGDHLIVRLSWLFGQGRPAFPEWLLAKARSQETVEIVGDKIACPTWSRAAVRDLMPWLQPGAISTGLLHYCNPPAITWADYAQEILAAAQEIQLPLLTKVITPVPIAKVTGLSARRPQNSALDVAKFTRLSGHTPCVWQRAIREHLAAT